MLAQRISMTVTTPQPKIVLFISPSSYDLCMAVKFLRFRILLKLNEREVLCLAENGAILLLSMLQSYMREH